LAEDSCLPHLSPDGEHVKEKGRMKKDARKIGSKCDEIIKSGKNKGISTRGVNIGVPREQKKI
jgi:hypothetical protein